MNSVAQTVTVRKNILYVPLGDNFGNHYESDKISIIANDISLESYHDFSSVWYFIKETRRRGIK